MSRPWRLDSTVKLYLIQSYCSFKVKYARTSWHDYQRKFWKISQPVLIGLNKEVNAWYRRLRQITLRIFQMGSTSTSCQVGSIPIGPWKQCVPKMAYYLVPYIVIWPISFISAKLQLRTRELASYLVLFYVFHNSGNWSFIGNLIWVEN
jgi:hypothetical protein